jgi:periplasmic copper chaperone A
MRSWPTAPPARLIVPLLAVGVVVLATAVPAAAHVLVNPREAERGASAELALHLEHGCAGSPTVALRMLVPAVLEYAEPLPVEGWDAEVVEEADRTEIIWRGGPLPSGQAADFPFRIEAPSVTDEAVYFPVIQECTEGEIAWIEIPDDLAGWRDLDTPAPYLRLTGKAPASPSPSPPATPTQTPAPTAAPTPTVTATAPPTPDEPPAGADGRGTPWWVLASAVGGLGLLGAVTVLARRRTAARR